jgi:hypothetical protein
VESNDGLSLPPLKHGLSELPSAPVESNDGLPLPPLSPHTPRSLRLSVVKLEAELELADIGGAGESELGVDVSIPVSTPLNDLCTLQAPFSDKAARVKKDTLLLLLDQSSSLERQGWFDHAWLVIVSHMGINRSSLQQSQRTANTSSITIPAAFKDRFRDAMVLHSAFWRWQQTDKHFETNPDDEGWLQLLQGVSDAPAWRLKKHAVPITIKSSFLFDIAKQGKIIHNITFRELQQQNAADFSEVTVGDLQNVMQKPGESNSTTDPKLKEVPFVDILRHGLHLPGLSLPLGDVIAKQLRDCGIAVHHSVDGMLPLKQFADFGFSFPTIRLCDRPKLGASFPTVSVRDLQQVGLCDQAMDGVDDRMHLSDLAAASGLLKPMTAMRLAVSHLIKAGIDLGHSFETPLGFQLFAINQNDPRAEEWNALNILNRFVGECSTFSPPLA